MRNGPVGRQQVGLLETPNVVKTVSRTNSTSELERPAPTLVTSAPNSCGVDEVGPEEQT